MTEREKVLLQRDTIRDLVRRGILVWSPAEICRLFPLPKKRVPNVQRHGDGDDVRVSPETGRVQRRSDPGREWRDYFTVATDAALRAVIAKPWIEVEDDGTERSES